MYISMRRKHHCQGDGPAARRTVVIWFLEPVDLLHGSSRLPEGPLLLAAGSLASPILVEARSVVFPKALIVMCPPGKHGANTSGKTVVITALMTLGMMERKARLMPQYKDQASTANQRAENTKEKGKKEAFIGGSRSRSQAMPGDVPGAERDVEHSTRYQVTHLTRSDEVWRSMTVNDWVQGSGSTACSKQGLTSKPFHFVSLLKPSSLRSAGEAIRQIGLGGCDGDSQTLGLDSSLASSADSHSACASKVGGGGNVDAWRHSGMSRRQSVSTCCRVAVRSLRERRSLVRL